MEVHFFPDSALFARRLARQLRAPARAIQVHRFPDEESRVSVATPVASRVVLVRQLHDPNPKLFELLLAADALHRAGARRVSAVVPYLPYMRQDTVFRPGECVSQQVLASTLGERVEEVLTLEAHLHRTHRLSDVFPCRARSLSAAPLLAEWCERGRGRAVLVGPDEESEPWVKAVARRAHLPFVVARKERLGDRRVRIELPPLPDVRRAVLLDDIASSGTTLASATRALRKAGIASVDAAVAHAIFAPGALARIRKAGIGRIVSCDTVPHETNAIGTAAHLAAALGKRS